VVRSRREEARKAGKEPAGANGLRVMGYGHASSHEADTWQSFDVTDGVSDAGHSVDTADDMHDERVPQRVDLRTVVRSYAIPLLLFFAAAVAAVVLALR